MNEFRLLVAPADENKCSVEKVVSPHVKEGVPIFYRQDLTFGLTKEECDKVEAETVDSLRRRLSASQKERDIAVEALKKIDKVDKECYPDYKMVSDALKGLGDWASEALKQIEELSKNDKTN